MRKVNTNNMSDTPTTTPSQSKRRGLPFTLRFEPRLQEPPKWYPALISLLAVVVALIKPPFEVGKGRVGKGGAVREKALHDEVLRTLGEAFLRMGLEQKAAMPSPLLGPKGNKEFFIHLEVSSKEERK